MLIDVHAEEENTPFEVCSRQIQTGVYEDAFGFCRLLEGYLQWPAISIPYGVADNVEQILLHVPELHDPNRQFFVTYTTIRKKNQEEEGGWRWCKWGPYIGAKNSMAEYLYDEPDIDQVICFSVYERLNVTP